MKLYILPKQDPRYNCALERACLEQGEAFLLCTTVAPSVFIGTDISALTYNKENIDNVPLTRYNGRGGPVYFDDGNVKVSFLTGSSVRAADICAAWIVRALRELGVPADHEPNTNDIFLRGKKIGGIGTTAVGGKLFLPFFLSLHIDFEVAARVMHLQKHTTNLAERAVGINDTAGPQLTADQIFTQLVARYDDYWDDPLEEAALPATVTATAAHYQTIYESEDWLLYGDDGQD